MRLYEVTASCLVDDVVLHWYVKDKNLCLACGRAYINLIKNPVVDVHIRCGYGKGYRRIT